MMTGSMKGRRAPPTDCSPHYLSRLARQAEAWLVVLFVLVVAGCASPERLPPVPPDAEAKALPLGLVNARFIPLEERSEMTLEFTQAVQRQRQALGLTPEDPLPTAYLLAISGGGDNGAFGSGLLVGWSEAGDRPEFQIVTGVSTGALIAPFAFLGPEYDRQLRDVYTTISAEDVFVERGLITALYSDAMADTAPLWGMISRFVDASMMEAIAREHQKGRLLLIGSTDLDTQSANIWNIGAIAASGHPDALDLIRNVLRASSAVPGVFQPVLINVEFDGRPYQELHVDGGAIAQMFLYPPNIDVREIAHENRKAYLIRNAPEVPPWANVEPRTLSIAGRAISTMIHTSGENDLLRIYFVTQLEEIDYNLAYIGKDFSATPSGDFDKDYMNALFDYSYQQALQGYPWKKVPPLLVGLHQ
jgi:predicted patatin/cPLA2 family phospholipase